MSRCRRRYPIALPTSAAHRPLGFGRDGEFQGRADVPIDLFQHSRSEAVSRYRSDEANSSDGNPLSSNAERVGRPYTRTSVRMCNRSGVVIGNDLASNGGCFLPIKNRHKLDVHKGVPLPDKAVRSLASKIPTPVRAAVSNQRPMIFTQSPAFARSCGDIEIHFLRSGSHLSWGMLQVALTAPSATLVPSCGKNRIST
jgi:hypothetical protein